jgi:hypothetical protein
VTWHALILALILWPSDPQLAPQAPPEAWAALREVALALEIVGPHEGWSSDFSSELCYVRRHYHALRTAPALADSCWLPPPDFADEMIAFNNRYREHLATRLALHPWRDEPIERAQAETLQLRCLWDAARRAQSRNESWAMRRRKLMEIRDAIGEDAWRRGELPSAVPVWQFIPVRD